MAVALILAVSGVGVVLGPLSERWFVSPAATLPRAGHYAGHLDGQDPLRIDVSGDGLVLLPDQTRLTLDGAVFRDAQTALTLRPSELTDVWTGELRRSGGPDRDVIMVWSGPLAP